MFKHLFKAVKGQNTAEYALLIALVVAGVIAMQTYVQRSLQAKMRNAGMVLSHNTELNGITTTEQYEPYYQSSNYVVTRNATENTRQGRGLIAHDSSSNRTRADQGFQESTYDTTGATGGH
ncbi:MAG: hypothetical protein HYZ86_01310 [Candidatus Omnitrophica bacterium]|nr:hypothetical protein [Candidatus Omnitrophota bacterium]